MVTTKFKRKKLTGLNLVECNQVLNDNIKNKKQHRDYDRVVAIAEDYKAYITGDGLEKKLKQFMPRETEVMFAQRVNLTRSVLPAVCSKLMKPAQKIPKLDPVVNKVDWEGNDKKIEEMTTELQYNLDHYNGENTLDDYMGDRYINSNYIDPNSWTITTYDSFDSNKEKAAPYPIHVSASEAINFDKVNNEIKWLITKWDNEYKVAGDPSRPDDVKTMTGKEYRIWTFDWVVKLMQCDPRKGESHTDGAMWSEGDDTGSPVFYTRISAELVFIRVEVEHKAGFVPAGVNGCKPDMLTESRTYVNMFHEAVSYFEKTIKVVSEMDITMTLHAFLQKIAYQPRCPGVKKPDGTRGWLSCDGGKLQNGATCPKCDGSGFIVHKTAQDAIYLGIPQNKEDMFDLDKLVKYVDIPINILEFQDKYLDKLVDMAINCVYNSSVYIRDTTVATATEKKLDYQSSYDTLNPLKEGYERMRILIVRSVATYIDFGDGLIVAFQYPKDLQFKTVNDLLDDLKAANDSKAPAFFVQELNKRIAKNIYADQPDELKKLEVKQRFDPFEGKSTEEIFFILTNKKCEVEDDVLYSNFKKIFEMAENDPELVKNKLWFYDLANDKQNEIIDRIVQELIPEIEKRNVQTVTPDFSAQ